MRDDELISRAKQGDSDAWRELYRAHAGRLVAWLGTRADADAAVAAEDLASEAWLLAAEKIPDFSGNSSDFAGWLFSIARRLAWNSHRRAQRRRTDPTAVEDDWAGAAPAYPVDENDHVRVLLANLPPRERDVVGCIDGLGFDVSATAVALDISPVAVRVARHRGLRRLRKQFGDGSSSDSVPEPAPRTRAD